MNSLAESILILWGILTFALLFYSIYFQKKEKNLLAPLSRSESYAQLNLKLDYLFKHYEIDQLRIEQKGVTVTSFFPAHTLLNFDFKHNGNSKRCNSISRLMSQLIYIDFPLLAQRDVYKLTSYCIYRSNGKKEHGYAFTMRQNYKDRLIRAKRPVQLRIL